MFDLAEATTKILGHHGVEDWVEAGVGVGHHVGHHLVEEVNHQTCPQKIFTLTHMGVDNFFL